MGVGVGDGLGVGVGVDVGVDVVPPPQAASNIASSSEQNTTTIPDGIRLKCDVMFLVLLNVQKNRQYIYWLRKYSPF